MMYEDEDDYDPWYDDDADGEFSGGYGSGRVQEFVFHEEDDEDDQEDE